jgi:hypothetical protein
MKLEKKNPEDYRKKSKRPNETKHLSLERIARGIVTASSEVLFQVELSKKRLYIFEKEDAIEYNQPRVKAGIRCIYHGNKNNLLPYAIYDLNWNLIWKEK